MLTSSAPICVIEVYDFVKEELNDFFADSDYATETLLIDHAASIISLKISNSVKQNGHTEESLSNAVYHSLFEHNYMVVDAKSGLDMVLSCPASTFMKFLASAVVDRVELQVLKQLRNILTGSGFGNLFEVQMHRTLYKKFSAGGVLRLTPLFPSGRGKHQMRTLFRWA